MASAWAGAEIGVELDRPYTLRNGAPDLLEAEYRRQIEGKSDHGYILPRPCRDQDDTVSICASEGGWSFHDSARNRRLAIAPVTALEYRRNGENALAWELGAVSSGATGPLSFIIDARLFTEIHEDPNHPSHDREFVERQSAQASGVVGYSSYARYRSSFGYDWSWGRLVAARDAVHWGPGLFGNLAFQQNTVPFAHLVFTSRLGPVRIASLYGQLAIDGNSSFRLDSNTRSLYAHRYEWTPVRNVTIGMSEQLILFNSEDAFAFVPVVPLFINKGTQRETENNGNLSFDLAYRWIGRGSIYTEFLIDDLQSPTSLFDNAYGNKWAWMFGAHLIRDTRAGAAGAIMEFSHVEPWVYTHYRSGTSQAANGGYPLGNPHGPNSRAIILKAYLRSASEWYVGAMAQALWKGKDPGSNVNDEPGPLQDRPKHFLSGVDGPEMMFSPYVFRTFGSAYAEGKVEFRSPLAAWVRVGFRY